MDENILDYNDDLQETNKVKSWTSIFILWLGIVISIFYGFGGEVPTTIAIGLLFISSIVHYFNKEIGVKFTLFVIFLGVLDLISFFPITYKFGISFFEYGIGFELILFSIGVVHCVTNRKIFGPIIKSFFNSSEEENKAIARANINGYKYRFARKSTDELINIVNEGELLPLAIQAAKELINERQKK